MSAHVENLDRAARLLRRIADAGGVSEFEGVSMLDIVGDVLMAAHGMRTQELADSFRCTIDESAGLADVVELRGYSRKAPCA